MIDIQHDSPVPIHEQIAMQIMAHIASGALKAGAKLAEYRALAQGLVTNPQVVARAYADLEWEQVLKPRRSGEMEVTESAAGICRVRLQERARQRIRETVGQGRAWGLSEADIRQAVEQELGTPVLSPDETRHAIKNATHARSHRTSEGIQILPRKEGGGPAQPERATGSDFRASG